MQGWRISMEDAHAAVLDLQIESDKEFQAAGPDDRLSFFGVYDGHGGDKVALFAGEHIHKILAKQEAFRNKDFEQALKDAFLATDRAILGGKCRSFLTPMLCLDTHLRSQIRGGGIRMHRLSRTHFQDDHLRGMNLS